MLCPYKMICGGGLGRVGYVLNLWDESVEGWEEHLDAFVYLKKTIRAYYSRLSIALAQAKEPTLKHKFEGHGKENSNFIFLCDNIHIMSSSLSDMMCK